MNTTRDTRRNEQAHDRHFDRRQRAANRRERSERNARQTDTRLRMIAKGGDEDEE